MNFLQVSEPQAAAMDTAQAAAAYAEHMKETSSNALVSQYGPEAADPALQQSAINANNAQQTAPTAIATANAEGQQKQLEIQQGHVLNAARAMKAAMASGQDAGTAYDQTVAPNAAVLGMDPAETATMRQHFVSNPASLDAVINGLEGPAKPEGAPTPYRNADGSLALGQMNTRGEFNPTVLPKGATAVSPTLGAMQVMQNPDGTYSYVQHDKAGNLVMTPAGGTPVPAMTAQTGQGRLAVGQQNANTNAFSAGVRSNNTQFGAPAGTAPGAPAALTPSMSDITQGILSSFPGTRMTSSTRTPAQNAAANGVSNSEHLSGNAADFHIPSNLTGQQFAAQIQSKYPGAKVIYEGPGAANSTAPHVHVELDGVPAPVGQGGAAGPNRPALYDALPPKGRLVADGEAQTLQNSQQQLDSIRKQVANVESLISPFSVGLGSVTAHIPGSPAFNMHEALGTLEAQGLTTWLNSMKSGGSGSTGIGRVLQSEANAAMKSFGALSQGQSEPQFRLHLGIFFNRALQANATGQQAFQQKYGRSYNDVMGNAPAGGAASAGGWKVLN